MGKENKDKIEISCTFCEFPRMRREILWQNELFYSAFDAYPVNPGHFLIIPKRHVVDLSDLYQKEWDGLKRAIEESKDRVRKTDLRKVYEKLLMDSPGIELSGWYCRRALYHAKINSEPDGYNYGINDGTAAGRTVNHFHLHVIPRYIGDTPDPRGGVRYVIPEIGNYKIPRV